MSAENQTFIPTADIAPRGNRPGVVIPGQGRSSQIITTIIPAQVGNVPGVTPIDQAGITFYLPLATGTVYIKPSNGSENQYTQGTGERALQNPFTRLEVRNRNPFNVIISIFVGFGDYIDNRAILYNPLISNIVYPTYAIANTLGNLLIPDLSGGALNDLNGTQFLALSRIGIYVSNLDLGVTYNLVNTANTKSVLAVPPSTDIVFPVNGNLRITVPAGNINALVSEVYSAILPTIT